MTVTLIGRQSELEAVEALLDRARRGASALLLAGEPGIGKSVVWEEGLSRARRRRFRVLVCRPTGSEIRLSLAALGDLLGEAALEVLPELPPPQQRALQTALLLAGEERGAADERAVAVASLGVLRLIAARRPLLVAVDDVHWLDRASASVMSFAARRLSSEHVGLLLTVRVAPDSSPPVDFERALGDRLTHVTLGPLSLAAIYELLRSRLGLELPRPQLIRLRESTAGNPLFALELGKELQRTGAELRQDRPLPLPDRLRPLLRNRVGRLRPVTREVLLAASMLSQATAEALEAALGAGHVRPALAEALGAEVVSIEGERIRFAHPLLASAIDAETTPKQRRELHHRLASAVDDPEERARHLALSATGPGEPVAAALEQAARRAAQRGAPQAAAELADLATELTPKEERDARARRTADAGGYHFASGDLRRARMLLEDALEAAPAGQRRANLLRLLGEVHYLHDSFGAAIELFERALADAEEPGLRGQIRLDLAFAGFCAADFRGAYVHALDGVTQAELAGEQALLAEALAVLSMIDFFLGRGIERANLERALALEDPDRRTPLLMRPSAIAAFLALYSGDLSGARSQLTALRERALERGEDEGLPLVLAHLAWTEYLCGELDAADHLSREALEIATQMASESQQALTLALRSLVHAHRGDEVAARADAGKALAIAERITFPMAAQPALCALAGLELSLGNARDALRAIAPLLELVPPGAIVEPFRAPFLPDAIDALVSVGELARAETLTDTVEASARALARPSAIAVAARCRGLVSTARGDSEGAAAALESALAEPELPPFERGRTLLALGMVLRRGKRKRPAREALDQAIAAFEETGAALWAERARAERGRISGRRAAPAELTETERRVAELVAAGLANKEIASALFVSVRTVESHLSHAYRKLGVRSRTELARLVNAEETPVKVP